NAATDAAIWRHCDWHCCSVRAPYGYTGARFGGTAEGGTAIGIDHHVQLYGRWRAICCGRGIGGSVAINIGCGEGVVTCEGWRSNAATDAAIWR
ncbi:hypothetical protein ABFO59_15205, partial [Acinetobacter radioresistens]|uniref:hypothetical protein n=1 Tax=Acinetobacter radioresistens TaxID=40216 RepID=UPI0032142D4D